MCYILVSHPEKRHRLKVQNRLLRRIFGRKGEEATGGWRKLHTGNEDLYNLYSSLNIIRAIKYRRMRWVGNVAFVGGMRNAYKILVGKSERKLSLEDQGTDGRIY
jgi:hypothetical protein